MCSHFNSSFLPFPLYSVFYYFLFSFFRCFFVCDHDLTHSSVNLLVPSYFTPYFSIYLSLSLSYSFHHIPSLFLFPFITSLFLFPFITSLFLFHFITSLFLFHFITFLSPLLGAMGLGSGGAFSTREGSRTSRCSFLLARTHHNLNFTLLVSAYIKYISSNYSSPHDREGSILSSPCAIMDTA